MDIETDLQQLLERIGLDRQEIARRLDFLHWRDADARRLNSAAAELDQAHAAFIDDFYRELGAVASLQPLLADPAVLQRLKRSQQDYYRRL